MPYQIQLLILSAVILIGFLVYSYFKHEFTKSISILFYHYEKPWRYLYSIAMVGTGVPTMIAFNEWTFYIAGAAICLTGIFADTRRTAFTQKVHVYSATSGLVLGLAGFWIHYGMWEFSVIGAIIAGLMWYFKFKNHTYWIEFFIFGWCQLGGYIVFSYIDVLDQVKSLV